MKIKKIIITLLILIIFSIFFYIFIEKIIINKNINFLDTFKNFIPVDVKEFVKNNLYRNKILKNEIKNLNKIIQNKENIIQNLYLKDNLKCLKKINDNYLNKKTDFNKKYSFFIAGHTYGSPFGENLGLYKNFYKEIIKEKNNYDFGIFAGDFSRDGSLESWVTVDKQIKDINLFIYRAIGNHDFSYPNKLKKISYEERYGKSYYYKYFENNLFIFLDPYLDKWSILGDQLKFFKSTISKNSNNENIQNIFIISNPMLYYDNNKTYLNNTYLKSKAGKGVKTNFWNTIFPILNKINKNIYIVSGDTGSTIDGKEFLCDNLNNISFLSTGMGGGYNDNYLIFQFLNGKLNIKLKLF